MESERPRGKLDKNGAYPMICPRCGGHSYYKVEIKEDV